jgi:hypothetical protein
VDGKIVQDAEAGSAEQVYDLLKEETA